MLKALVEQFVRGLVDAPDEVEVTETIEDRTSQLVLRVRTEDLGKVIGKQGRTIAALRTVLGAAAARQNRRAVLQVQEQAETA